MFNQKHQKIIQEDMQLKVLRGFDKTKNRDDSNED